MVTLVLYSDDQGIAMTITRLRLLIDDDSVFISTLLEITKFCLQF